MQYFVIIMSSEQFDHLVFFFHHFDLCCQFLGESAAELFVEDFLEVSYGVVIYNFHFFELDNSGFDLAEIGVGLRFAIGLLIALHG